MQDKAATSPRHIRIQASDGSGSFNGYLAVPRSGSGPCGTSTASTNSRRATSTTR